MSIMKKGKQKVLKQINLSWLPEVLYKRKMPSIWKFLILKSFHFSPWNSRGFILWYISGYIGLVYFSQFSAWQDHLSGCQFVVVNCKHNCGKQLQRRDIHQHMEAECLYRKTPCKHCEDPVLWNEVEASL